MVSSTVVMLTSRISSESSSRVEMILRACPGIGGDTVLRRTFGPENFTSTWATADLELAKSSLRLSILLLLLIWEEVVEEEGDGNSNDDEVGMFGLEIR